MPQFRSLSAVIALAVVTTLSVKTFADEYSEDTRVVFTPQHASDTVDLTRLTTQITNDPLAIQLPFETHMVVVDGQLSTEDNSLQTGVLLAGGREFYTIFVLDGVVQAFDMHSTGLMFVLKNTAHLYFENGGTYDILQDRIQISNDLPPLLTGNCCGMHYVAVPACLMSHGTVGNDIFDIDVTKEKLAHAMVLVGRGGEDTAVVRVPYQIPGQITLQVRNGIVTFQYVHGNGNVYVLKGFKYVVFNGGEDILTVRPAEGGHRERLASVCHFPIYGQDVDSACLPWNTTPSAGTSTAKAK